MGKLKEIVYMIPGINVLAMVSDWSDGKKYTIDDNENVKLTPELADSLKEIDDKYETHHTSSKGKAGKGRGKYKVDASKLNKVNESKEIAQDEKTEDLER